MLFGQETRPIADFLPRILAHIDGVDEEMVAILAMDAVIQFVRDSQILSEVVCVTLEPCIESYKLHTRLRPYEVLALRVFRMVGSNHSMRLRLRWTGISKRCTCSESAPTFLPSGRGSPGTP